MGHPPQMLVQPDVPVEGSIVVFVVILVVCIFGAFFY